MRMIHVGAAALNQTPLDWENNTANIREALRQARERGVALLCLPEMCLCGYGCEDAFFAPATRRMARRALAELLPETSGLAVSFGLPVMHLGSLFNACALAVDGRIVGVVPKQHLAGDGLHYEPRWFKPWPPRAVAEVELDGARVPFGDLVFDLDGVRVGFEICEDAWTAGRPGAALAERGVDVILNPSASHFAFGKQAIRRRLVVDGSRAFGVSYLYSNLLGNEAGRAIYDGGLLIGTCGAIVAGGRRFSFEPVVLAETVVDIDATRTQRAQLASRSSRIEPEHGLIATGFALPAAQPVAPGGSACDWEKSDTIEEEEFARAIALGLFDYARKSRSRGFVVSLSGGADSTAVAALIRLMVDLGLAEIGMVRMCKAFGLIPFDPRPAKEGNALTDAVLTTAYQATRNSSPATRNAAQTVADAIGARHYTFDIDALNRGYIAMIEGALDRELTWARDDIALQNIQARVRAPGVWMLANLENKLLVATSNRSEAAVGYATMDGDTCGGVSPIAGIDKAFLLDWLVWLEKTGPEGIGPIPAVGAVNRLTPTAELRPPGETQTDEEDLMPYDILDAIEHQAIGRKRSPTEAFGILQPRFPQYPAQVLADWIERFFTLVVSQSMEARALRPQLPRGRQESRPAHLVPLSHLVGRIPPGTGRTAVRRRRSPFPRIAGESVPRRCPRLTSCRIYTIVSVMITRSRAAKDQAKIGAGIERTGRLM
jgi:NAD+ synthase (glutamine-hydrolysing)